MTYLGSSPTSQNFISGTDYFNGTGSQTAFTLTRSVNSVNDVEVVVNNVIQQPNSYTVSGTTLTLSAAPSAGTSNVYVRYLATNQQSFTVGNNTIDYNKLTSDMQSKFAMKNRIINGAMVIDQRNAGSSITVSSGSTSYPVDRMLCYVETGSSGTFTAQQSSSAPVGFKNSVILTTATTDSSITAAEGYSIQHRVEGYNIADLGWGTADAKTVTLSFWVKSSLTGTFAGSVTNGSFNRAYVFNYSISAANTWEQKTIIVTGDTGGTWNSTNGIGLIVYLSVGAGSNYNQTAGTWGSFGYSTAGAVNVIGTASANISFTGVQLEVGTSATGYEYRQYQQELALCQRYYWNLTQSTANAFTNYAICYVGSATAAFAVIQNKVSMRTPPSVSYPSTITKLKLSNTSTTNYTISAISVDSANGTETTQINITSSGLTTGQALVLANNNDTAGFLALSAEL